MAISVPAIAWDSCVILDAIQKTPVDRYSKIEPLILEAEKKNLKIVVSELSIIECSWLRELDAAMSLSDQQKLLDRWFESPFIVRRPLIPRITEKARILARKYGLRAADAIVMATALCDNLPYLYTGDGLTSKSGKKLIPLSGLEGDPRLIICSPPDPATGTLFAKTTP